MRDDIDLKEFAESQLQQIVSAAEAGGGDDQREDEFTRLMLDYLADAGEIGDSEVCYHGARGLKVNGYAINHEADCLDLFYSYFTQVVPPNSVPRSEIDTGFKRLSAFLAKAVAGYRSQLIQPSPAHDMASQIEQWRPALKRVRLLFLTDGLTNVETIPDEERDGLTCSFHIWDIRRVFRLASSGQQREPLEIDFAKLSSGPLPCLPMPGARPDYQAYLVVVPGKALAEIYAQFGARLLERNVRAFLQARGKVNRGIRDTLAKEPDRFFAYNNGISATASEVRFGPLPSGGLAISWARDFQIVNGGQTTASIYHAFRNEADLSNVAVQAKLSVVRPDKLEVLVPLISRYANSQNKVSEADLSANDPFHVHLEQLSRTVWAPPAPGQQRQTRWFYERARGQYEDEKARAPTSAARRDFAAANPPRQRFTKADLAKYENTWVQMPHIVSRGGEKNFWEFSRAIVERKVGAPDEHYFRRLVAKAILFRSAERIVQSLAFGGYRANIVTYSIAFLSHVTSMRIDLDRVWREQAITPALEQAVTAVARRVHGTITAPPGGKNVTEWCKQKECWTHVTGLVIEWPHELLDELIPVGDAQRNNHGDATSEFTKRVADVPPEKWFEVAEWAKKTGNLRASQRRLADAIGSMVARGQRPTARQAAQGAELLQAVEALGFAVQPSVEAS